MATRLDWEGIDMTRTLTSGPTFSAGSRAGSTALRADPARMPRVLPAGPAACRSTTSDRRRPGPARPAVAPMRYRTTGVAVSRGPHRQRPITPAATVGLAVLAAMITIWLGLVAQFGDAVHGAEVPVPDRLAVVQVRGGETLQHLAARVAPDAPAAQVAARIRELNELDSVALTAGQTLIAPVG